MRNICTVNFPENVERITYLVKHKFINIVGTFISTFRLGTFKFIYLPTIRVFSFKHKNYNFVHVPFRAIQKMVLVLRFSLAKSRTLNLIWAPTLPLLDYAQIVLI